VDAFGPGLESRELLDYPGLAPQPHRVPHATALPGPSILLNQQLDAHEPLTCFAILMGHRSRTVLGSPRRRYPELHRTTGAIGTANSRRSADARATYATDADLAVAERTVRPLRKWPGESHSGPRLRMRPRTGVTIRCNPHRRRDIRGRSGVAAGLLEARYKVEHTTPSMPPTVGAGRPRVRRAWLAVLGACWLGTVGAGLWVVRAYDNAPGVSADAPARWPAGTPLVPASSGPTLVMLAHPMCPCTRASIDELAEALARSGRAAKTYVLFLRPAGFAEGWEQSDLWKRAAAIPGVTPIADDRGVEAARFGTSTSGQTLLYGADGRLVFSGGITGSRGHAGENEGRARLVALLTGAGGEPARTKVFGCPLFAQVRSEGTPP
jgi:hypothetical protein